MFNNVIKVENEDCQYDFRYIDIGRNVWLQPITGFLKLSQSYALPISINIIDIENHVRSSPIWLPENKILHEDHVYDFDDWFSLKFATKYNFTFDDFKNHVISSFHEEATKLDEDVENSDKRIFDAEFYDQVTEYYESV